METDGIDDTQPPPGGGPVVRPEWDAAAKATFPLVPPTRVPGRSARTLVLVALSLVVAGGALLLVKAIAYGIYSDSKGAAAIGLAAPLLIVAGSAVNFFAIRTRNRERAAGYTTIAWPKRAARGLWLLASNGQVARPPTE